MEWQPRPVKEDKRELNVGGKKHFCAAVVYAQKERNSNMSDVKKILVIDDNQNMRNALKRMIQEKISKVDIMETGDAQQAAAIAEMFVPDLILLDVLMPGMNGLEVLKSIRKSSNDVLKSVPVFMLTSILNKEIILKSKQLGAVDYITKPFNENIFFTKLRKYLYF